MRKEKTGTYLLGGIQLDMAMLLRVHTRHVSMFCSGRRALPLHANIGMAEMLDYLRKQEHHGKRPIFCNNNETKSR